MPWLTYDFIDQCQDASWLVALRKTWCRTLQDEETALAQMAAAKSEYRNSIRKEGHARVPMSFRKLSNIAPLDPWAGPFGSRFQRELSPLPTCSLYKRNCRWDPCVHLCGTHCKRPTIPGRLLHGPWTQDKGLLLEMLMMRGAVIEDRRAVQRGLLDAIEESCFPAFVLLTFHRRMFLLGEIVTGHWHTSDYSGYSYGVIINRSWVNCNRLSHDTGHRPKQRWSFLDYGPATYCPAPTTGEAHTGTFLAAHGDGRTLECVLSAGGRHVDSRGGDVGLLHSVGNRRAHRALSGKRGDKINGRECCEGDVHISRHAICKNVVL